MADFQLTRYRGNTLILPVTVADAGEAVDLTGAAIQFQLADYTLDTEGVTLTPETPDATGVFKITVSAALMAALTGQYHLFEVTVTDTGGAVLTYFVGGLFLKDKVIDDA